MKLMQWLRTLHGWLGVLILPWVIVIGFTGFYLNHRNILPESEIDLAAFSTAADHIEIDQAYALKVAQALHPDLGFIADDVAEDSYHDQPSFILEARRQEVIVLKSSGYYFDKSPRQRITYNPKGEVIHRKTYWSGYFKELHERGWVGNSFGTFLADLTAIGMMIFGLSGLYLFFYPRVRRWRARQAQ